MNNIKQFIDNELEIIPPAGINLKIGDKVKWVNTYGVEWTHKVIGFNTTREYNKEYKKFVHLDTDCFWFPHSADKLTKIN